MEQIKGYEEAKKILGDFDFHEFRMLKELHLFQGDEGYDLILLMESIDRKPNYQLKLRFSKIEDLKIEDMHSYQAILGFEITDISDRQMEGLHWSVSDYEDSRLRFYSYSFEILSVLQVDE